jgi:hypothetical protein
VLENIKQIVREEMDAIGGQELIMSSLQKRSTWEETGRWDDEVVDVWFKTKLKDGTEVGLGMVARGSDHRDDEAVHPATKTCRSMSISSRPSCAMNSAPRAASCAAVSSS